MIPNHIKPKYKALVKLRIDVWNTLKTKLLNKKKWRLLLERLGNKRINLHKNLDNLKRRRRKPKPAPKIINYTVKPLPKFRRVYRKYKYQKDLYLRQSIKLMYGSLQDEKIKQYAMSGKNKACIGFITKLEQKAVVFLYRSRLTSTYGEGKMHFMHKRILVNGSYKIPYIKIGDVLHFTPLLEKLFKRRMYFLFLNFSKFYKKKKKFAIFQTKKKKIKIFNFHKCVDFDTSGFRFYFIDNIKYHKNHPFYLPFERVWRWYTRV